MKYLFSNERGGSIIEIIIVMALLASIIVFIFPKLAVSIVPSETTSIQENNVKENTSAKNENNDQTNNNHEGLKLVKKMKIKADPVDQSMRLGRGFKYDLEFINKKYGLKLTTFSYLEDDFFNHYEVYFEVGGKGYLGNLK